MGSPTEFGPWAKEEQSCGEDDPQTSATKLKSTDAANVSWTERVVAVPAIARSPALLDGMLAASGKIKELDLSGRQLTDATICSLAQALINGAAPGLRKLKLQKNRAETRAAVKVAEFIEKAHVPLSEVHLSHNYLDPQGVKHLLTSAAKRREYPLNGNAALWLRIEQQQCWEFWPGFDGSDQDRMRKSKDVLKIAEAKVLEIRRELGFIPFGLADRQLGPLICHVVSMKQQCNPSKCSCWHKFGPVIHVTYFWQQGRTFANSSKKEGPRVEPNLAMDNGWCDYRSRQSGSKTVNEYAQHFNGHRDWTNGDWTQNNGWHGKDSGTAWQWNWEKEVAAEDEDRAHFKGA